MSFFNGEQGYISNRLPMPVDMVADTAYVNSITGETLQLYYFANAYLTTAATAATTYTDWVALAATSSFAIGMNGQTYIIKPDFTADTSMDDVAASIQVALRLKVATATCTWSTDHFVITTAKDESGDVHGNSITVLTNPSSNTGTDIAGSSWMNGKYGSGVVTKATLTTDAGQAAGTIVMGKLAYTGILDKFGAMIGNEEDTSLTWTTGTVLPAKYIKRFPYDVIENPSKKDAVDIAYEICKSFSSGEWCLDARNGVVYGKKATTGTSDTAAYKVMSQSSGSGTTITASQNLEKINNVDIPLDDAAFTVGSSPVIPIGCLADEASPDTVSEGDVGIPRMTLDRVLLAKISDGTNAPIINAAWAETLALANDNLSVGAGMYGMDADAGTPIMRACQVAVDNATVSGTPNVLMIGGIYKNAADTYDDNDASPLHTDVSGNLKVDVSAQSLTALKVSATAAANTAANPMFIQLSNGTNVLTGHDASITTIDNVNTNDGVQVHSLLYGYDDTGAAETWRAVHVDTSGNVVLSSDIEIGAVEIKDSDSDNRVEVHAPNTAAMGFGLNVMPARYVAAGVTMTDTYSGPLMLDVSGNLKITASADIPTTITSGNKTVTTSGTAEALGASLAIKSVYIRAKGANTGNVYVGDSTVDKTTNQGIILAANDSVTLNISNRATVYIDSDTDGEGVDYVAMS